jgi:hypothetical protein
MSFREIAEQNGQASQDFMKPRVIMVNIFLSTKQIFKTLHLNVVPRQTPIDELFRFYEPENSFTTISLPRFVSLNVQDMQVVSSNPRVFAKIDPRNNVITI